MSIERCETVVTLDGASKWPLSFFKVAAWIIIVNFPCLAWISWNIKYMNVLFSIHSISSVLTYILVTVTFHKEKLSLSIVDNMKWRKYMIEHELLFTMHKAAIYAIQFNVSFPNHIFWIKWYSLEHSEVLIIDLGDNTILLISCTSYTLLFSCVKIIQFKINII